MTSQTPPEYLIERLQDALAADPRVGELGLEVLEGDGDLVVRGVVGSEERCRAIDAVARAAVPDVSVRNETSVRRVGAPLEEEGIS